MEKKLEQLLKYIEENKTMHEIRTLLGISGEELFTYFSLLEEQYYCFNRKYSSNGDIHYAHRNSYLSLEKEVTNIHSPNSIESIRAILIADTHFGNVKDEVKGLYQVIKYCLQQDIHLIFHLGDFFEGICSKYPSHFSSFQDQIRYGLESYPFSDQILTILILGNHDITFLLEERIDIADVIKKYRHDIVPVGYGYGKVLLGNYQFKLQHSISNKKIRILIPQDDQNQIILKGHSHAFKVTEGGNNLCISVPSFSHIKTHGGGYPYEMSIPSMIDMELKICGNKIVQENFKQFLLLNKRLVQVGECTYQTQIWMQQDVVDDRYYDLMREKQLQKFYAKK